MTITIRGHAPSRSGTSAPSRIQRTRQITRKLYAEVAPDIYGEVQTLAMKLPSKKLNAALLLIIQDWINRQHAPPKPARKPKRHPLTPPLPLVY